MNEIIDNIYTRRSIRDFNEKSISKEDISTLLECASYAPSGMNKQTWKFTAILNIEIIKELASAIEETLDRKEYNFYNASALIITSNEKNSNWGISDNACAMQNIMLASNSMNIGSVWINQFYGNCHKTQIRSILDRIGIPSNHIIHGVVALGYSSGTPKGKIEKQKNYVIIE